jgi:hypothetical protein
MDQPGQSCERIGAQDFTSHSSGRFARHRNILATPPRYLTNGKCLAQEFPVSNFAFFASFAVQAFDRKERKERLSGYNAALHQFQRRSESNLA